MANKAHREMHWWIERMLLKRGRPVRVKGCQGLRLGKKFETVELPFQVVFRENNYGDVGLDLSKSASIFDLLWGILFVECLGI